MNAPWRTETVVALCEAMRQSRDYSATPILADALEEAGYGDREVLKLFRENLPYWQAECLVALVYCDKTAEAIWRIKEIAHWLGPGADYDREDYDPELPMDYRRLMRAAHDWVDGKGGTTQWMGESWQESFPSRAPEFWQHFEIITGRKPPDNRGSFFFCTC